MCGKNPYCTEVIKFEVNGNRHISFIPNKKYQMCNTLADHAEAWMKETRRYIPAWGTKEWEMAYRDWIDFAFKDFPEV